MLTALETKALDTLEDLHSLFGEPCALTDAGNGWVTCEPHNNSGPVCPVMAARYLLVLWRPAL